MCRERSGQKACAALKFRCPPLLISPRTVPSSETAPAQTPAVSHNGGKTVFFMALASLQGKNLFSSLQSRLSDLATVARGCLKFADVTEGALAPADVYSDKKETCLQTPAKTCLVAAPSHYIAQTGSVPVPDSLNLAAFSEGGGDVRCADVLVFHQLCACLSVLP